MNVAILQNPKLVTKMVTTINHCMKKNKVNWSNWVLTSLCHQLPYAIRNYKSGHQFSGGKERQKNLSAQITKLVSLGTVWTLTRFATFRPCSIRTYKSGHHFQGGKEAFLLGGCP